jgi:hypothetical protein
MGTSEPDREASFKDWTRGKRTTHETEGGFNAGWTARGKADAVRLALAEKVIEAARNAVTDLNRIADVLKALAEYDKTRTP